VIDSTGMQATPATDSATAHPFLGLTITVYENFAGVRDTVLRPIARVMARLGATANLVSLASVLVVVPVVFTARQHPWAAAGCLFVSTLADQLDGSLARLSGTRSDRGKLVDMVCDNVAFTVYVIALIITGLATPVVGVLLVYTMLLSKTLRVVVHARSLRSDWLFRPVAGFLPNSAVGVMYLVFVAYAGSGRELFTPVGCAVAAVLAADAAWYLRRLLAVAPDSRSTPSPREGGER